MGSNAPVEAGARRRCPPGPGFVAPNAAASGVPLPGGPRQMGPLRAGVYFSSTGTRLDGQRQPARYRSPVADVSAKVGVGLSWRKPGEVWGPRLWEYPRFAWLLSGPAINLSMDPNTTPVTILLTKPDLELLDRAIGEFVTRVPEARPKFVLLCLRYCLLVLGETGDLDVEVDGGVAEFVQRYRDLIDRLKAQDTDSPA